MVIKEKTANEKKSLLRRILDILIVAAAVVLIIFLFQMISELIRIYDYDRYSISTFYLDDEDFGSMAAIYHVHNAEVAELSPSSRYYYDIAGYADAAFMQNILRGKGDAEGVSFFAQKKEQLRGRLSEYLFVTERIDEVLAPYFR